MVSCTEFVYAYSEIFRFIENKDGYEAVQKYWERISDDSIQSTLGKAVDEAGGIKGCYDYWSHTLNEEAADFRMEYDDEKKTFSIEMRNCPSRGRLNESGKDYYPRYCEHCDLLYRRVLEPRGMKYDYDFSGVDHARCKLMVEEIKK